MKEFPDDIQEPRSGQGKFLSRIRTFDSLRHGGYRLLWLASLGTSSGYFLQQVVIGWLVYDLTNSELLTALALGLDALPQLVGGPIGGALVDVWDRRKILIYLPLYQAALSIGFAILVMAGYLETWHILVFVPAIGSAWFLIEPARMAYTPQVVPRQRLVNAYALTQLAFATSRLTGPVIGGIVLALYGPGPTLLAQAGVQVSATIAALLIRTPPMPKTKINLRSVYEGLAEMYKYAKTNLVVPGLLLCAIATPLLVVPATSGLMPVYIADVFDKGPVELGLLIAVSGAGSIFGVIMLATFANMRCKGIVLLSSLAATGIFMAVASFTPFFGGALIVFMLIGIGYTITQTLSWAILATQIPDDLRGRVAGLIMATWGFLPAGSLLSGLLAERYSAPMATLVGGGLVIIFAIGVGLRFRSVRQI